MASATNDIYGVTILHPQAGGYPPPPADALWALPALDFMHDGPRSVGDHLNTGVRNFGRFALTAMLVYAMRKTDQNEAVATRRFGQACGL